MAFLLPVWGRSGLGKTKSDGLVTSGHESAAGLAEHILGDVDTVASLALVGVHSMTSLSDTAHFGRQVLDAHFAGLAFGESFTCAEGLENTERLGFRVDE